MNDNRSIQDPASSNLSNIHLNRRQKLLILRLKKEIHETLLNYMDLKRTVIRKTKDKVLLARVRNTIAEIINELSSDMPSWIDKTVLLKDVYDEITGLGPLEDYMADDGISEIMVNRRDQIYIERNGRLELTDATFVSDESIMGIIEKIISPLGRRIDESQPLVDARLPDGSRVHAIIPPLALDGPVVTIRKFLPNILSIDDYVRMGTLNKRIAEFLKHCVNVRCNIMTTGRTSSGKTTLLNLISSFIGSDERIITIEESAELAMFQEHIIRLEARPPNIEMKGEITVRELFRNSLRMRPDRIIIGECRAGETLDMLQAMNTGHDGSMTTVHANSPRDLIGRLETMAIIGNPYFPISTIRSLIASAIDIIVHLTRYSDGARRITQISELVGIKDGEFIVEDIYRYRKKGRSPKTGLIYGYFETIGYIPTFVETAREEGYDFPLELFSPSENS